MAHFWADATKRIISTAPQVLSFALFLGTLAVAGVATAGPPDGGRIGYVLTHKLWAVYETEDAAECPHGFNSGPREQFEELFPKDSDVERTVVETRLMREGRQWNPTTSDDPFPFYEAQGEISYGMNLDGKVGADDFQSPDGEKGIDNQLYRALGCISMYRVDGSIWEFDNSVMVGGNPYNRWMIELSDVDDLVNDDDVTVTTYRGLDDLVTDASGQSFVPGGTQRVDARWGQRYVEKVKGKIVDGVLTTEPIKMLRLPWKTDGMVGYHIFRDLQLQLNLTPKAAEGMLAGYVDVKQFIFQLNTNWATHHASYGQLSSPSVYRAMKRLADAYPDPETGDNTAISSAINVTLTQVYIVHPDEEKSIAGQ